MKLKYWKSKERKWRNKCNECMKNFKINCRVGAWRNFAKSETVRGTKQKE
jgi:hypothetical protein